MAGKLGRALVLLVLLAAALITQTPLAVFLLAFALVLLVLLRLDAAYLRRQVTAELLVPDKPVIQGEDFTLTVRLRNRSRLPIPALVVLLNAADEWGGGQITLRCAAMLGGKESAEQRITLNAGKSGVWSIAVRGITLRDHLGVFTAACPAAAQSRSICVLPAAAAGKAKAETAPDEDGDEADTRAALGGSYELREYRDGDTIKQVHWKLSAKLDRLMVREPLTALRAALTPGGDLDGAEEWGDFPQQAAKHRKNPPKRKKERTALSRRGAADPGSGLKFVDRVLVSTQRPAAHPALWLAADAALLLALTFGLLLVLSTGFGIAVPLWVWPAAAAFCAGWALFLRAPQALRRWGLLAGVIVYLVVLFICQRNFLAGAQQCAGNIAQSLNARLGSALPVAQGGSAAQLGLFLLLAALPVTGALAAAALRRADALLLDLMLLPVVVLLALAGAAPAVPACLLLLAGWMGAWAASCSVQRRALWGRRDTENYRQNLCRHYNIQKSAALAAGGLCLTLALPCWWLLRPALGVPLGWLQPAAQRVESAALSTAITWLPRVSGGRLNIQVEAAAGGVADGALNQGGGIQVSGVTDLALTASDKPEETVYLRGFIGGSYDGTTWQAPDADAFDSAAMNWKTEDNARLTIASLPFLRTAYDGTAQPQTLTVERIHADTQYTYAPYNAYWGDYYTIQGDGAAAGQTAQDDVFLYYPRDTAQTQLEARADADPSVLDRMEASYAAYAASRYTAVPDGYDELQTLCDEAKKDQKLTEAADIGDYIRAYLNTNYQYNASAPQPPEGADPIRYFLTESKQGYSVQFASAAVVMFRMFGLPARYVVGYAAPQSLFTQQENGSWHAILQDDNAHAWAEVYISGQGWTPMEMTPGVLVSAQQADLRTDPLPETQGQDTAPAAGESSANEPAATIVPRSRLVLAALLGGCLLAAAVLLVLARRHAMGYGRGSCNARVLAVFGSIYRLLVRRGLPPDTPSDAPEFAAFLQSCVPTLEPQDAEALLALAQAAQFGAGTMTEQDTDKMRKLYQVIKHTGKRKQSQKSVEKQSQE